MPHWAHIVLEVVVIGAVLALVWWITSDMKPGDVP